MIPGSLAVSCDIYYEVNATKRGRLVTNTQEDQCYVSMDNPGESYGTSDALSAGGVNTTFQSNFPILLSCSHHDREKHKIMARSRRLRTNSTRNMLVKIVHPGGHVELHDRPVLAAEIMLRNPRCCVAYPHVFQQPWAIVAPDTMLTLGQEFYVVPVSSIRKLQRHSFKYSPSAPLFPSPFPSPNTKARSQEVTKEEGQINSTCWSKMEKDECFSKDGCFVWLFKGTKLKANPEGASEASRSSSSVGSSQTRELTGRKRSKDIRIRGMRGSPKRLASYDNWQPRLESITEE